MAKKNMRGGDEVNGDVDMSPMIDCCFLLLIFFVINATAITVSKDPSVKMPTAVSASNLEDARGCIVVNIFNDVDKMDPKAREKFIKTYGSGPGIIWSDGKKGYTEDQKSELTKYLDEEKKRMLALPAGGKDNRKLEEQDIRVYLRGDIDAPWKRTAGAIECAADAGIPSMMFGTLPARN